MEDHRDQAHDLPRREPGLVISLPSLDAIFTHRKADNGPDSSIAEVASSSQPVVAAILEALLFAVAQTAARLQGTLVSRPT